VNETPKPTHYRGWLIQISSTRRFPECFLETASPIQRERNEPRGGRTQRVVAACLLSLADRFLVAFAYRKKIRVPLVGETIVGIQPDCLLVAVLGSTPFPIESFAHIRQRRMRLWDTHPEVNVHHELPIG
jgi:hypothetical protein